MPASPIITRLRACLCVVFILASFPSAADCCAEPSEPQASEHAHHQMPAADDSSDSHDCTGAGDCCDCSHGAPGAISLELTRQGLTELSCSFDQGVSAVSERPFPPGLRPPDTAS